MRAGRAIRDEAALRAAYDAPCPTCGHPSGVHRELSSTLSLVEGTIVETPHPDYRPLHFHCTADGCDCVLLGEGAEPLERPTPDPFDLRLRRVERAIGAWERRRPGRPIPGRLDDVSRAALRASHAVYSTRKVAEEMRDVLVVHAGNCPRCGGSGQYRGLGVCFRCGGSGSVR